MTRTRRGERDTARQARVRALLRRLEAGEVPLDEYFRIRPGLRLAIAGRLDDLPALRPLLRRRPR